MKTLRIFISSPGDVLFVREEEILQAGRTEIILLRMLGRDDSDPGAFFKRDGGLDAVCNRRHVSQPKGAVIYDFIEEP